MAVDTNTPKAPDPTFDNNIASNGEENYTMVVNDAYPGGFEGPEKLLEIWFSSSPNKLPKSRATSQYNTDDEQSEPSTPLHEDLENDTELILSQYMEEEMRRIASYRRYKGARDYKRGLRIVPRKVWDEMLAIVKCEVVNVIKNDFVDAYLLSESSMFVFPHKLILKTCGTTTLLHALPRILSIAHEYCHFEKVWRVFYSRKCFLFPERQLGPHKSWKNEVAFLDRHFENGSAYKIGKVNGDHWYLYLTRPADDVLLHHNGSEWEEDEEDDFIDVEADIMSFQISEPNMSTSSSDEDETSSRSSSMRSNTIRSLDTFTTPPTSDTELDATCHSSRIGGYPRRDQTVEILMHKLDPVAMRAFYQRSGEKPGTIGGHRVDKETGLDKLYPAAMLDSYLFTPCGYSANALLKGGYFTIHVTPEEACSYASFETNIPAEISHPPVPGSKKTAIQNLIDHVTSIFRPAEFCVSFFESLPDKTKNMSDSAYCEDDDEDDEMMHRERARMLASMKKVGGYKRCDRILYEFEGYNLVFGHYLKI